MAAQCNLFAAQTLLELVNRSVIGRVDTLQVVSRAAACDGPFHDAPLTSLANALLAQIAIGAGENHVDALADTQSEETGSEFAFLQRHEQHGLGVLIVSYVLQEGVDEIRG